jgi:hemoglobin
MNTTLKDIETRYDVELFVNRFYDKVKTDDLLGPVFKNLNWPHHLPVMYNFWSSLLLGDQTYSGNPLQKHLPLSIDAQHFQQWLKLFTQTLDENFSGEKTAEAKQRAQSIAYIFQLKMGIIKSN